MNETNHRLKRDCAIEALHNALKSGLCNKYIQQLAEIVFYESRLLDLELRAGEDGIVKNQWPTLPDIKPLPPVMSKEALGIMLECSKAYTVKTVPVTGSSSAAGICSGGNHSFVFAGQPPNGRIPDGWPCACGAMVARYDQAYVGAERQA